MVNKKLVTKVVDFVEPKIWNEKSFPNTFNSYSPLLDLPNEIYDYSTAINKTYFSRVKPQITSDIKLNSSHPYQFKGNNY